MNSKLLKYINYLLDNESVISPFCEYIISKELLRLDEKNIYEAYKWAVSFKLYAELMSEQLPDGSWGGFYSSITSISKNKNFKSTASAFLRISDLSLDTTDPMVNLSVELCKKYLEGEIKIPDSVGSKNLVQPVIIRRAIIQCLSNFEPDNIFVTELREITADRFVKSCERGYFDVEVWRELDINPTISDFSKDVILLLSYKGIIDDKFQRILLSCEWERDIWNNKLSKFASPEEPSFHGWLLRIEKLKNFTLFGEFMAENTAPYLYTVCERLCDKEDAINVCVNNYHYHYGQYTESPRSNQHKKNDLLLRIIRILEKCA